MQTKKQKPSSEIWISILGMSQLSTQKYGVPIYGAAWVPTNLLHNKKQEEEEELDSSELRQCLVLCGGGGEGKSGIPNSILLSLFNPTSNSLSPTPLSKIGTGADLPYRMAVHPGGDGVICSFPKSCRWFEWDVPESSETYKLDLKSSEKILTQMEDVGQQLAMTFNADGSALAVGGEDGHLRVFKWPSMEVILDENDAHARIKDLSFSSDENYLVSLGSGSSCRVWDVSSSKIVASLPKENDEMFGFCRFSQTKDNTQILYITAMRGQGGSIIYWDTTSWKRIGSKQVVRDPISAFNVSSDGEFLAVGTIQGDIYIVNSSMRVHTVIKKAHLGLVTVLMFSDDSRHVVSSSLDSSARVTLIESKKKQNGLSIWVVLVVLLLTILAYILALVM
ncbi:hypothetical protein IFM89_002646 [Coptis chinensis]|uniref:Prolactin regulatory element-binding protein n=1 Tax=Coptis chinensis TaxID=261450 RepID=A0A835INE6_9MAGN|nr:hypothetical protein IFM89_002646 [Coptis chinensis]